MARFNAYLFPSVFRAIYLIILFLTRQADKCIISERTENTKYTQIKQKRIHRKILHRGHT